nr:hypothetical protein [uncultured Campylobacter sp.]
MRSACSCECNEAKISFKSTRETSHCKSKILKAQYFFFRLGGNDGGEGAYM